MWNNPPLTSHTPSVTNRPSESPSSPSDLAVEPELPGPEEDGPLTPLTQAHFDALINANKQILKRASEALDIRIEHAARRRELYHECTREFELAAENLLRFIDHTKTAAQKEGQIIGVYEAEKAALAAFEDILEQPPK